MVVTHGGRRTLASPLAPVVRFSGVGAAALAVGAIYVLTAYKLSPALLPGVAIVGIAARIAWKRPYIGVALGLAFIPARTFGFSSGETTYLVVSWSIYIAFVAFRQRELAADGSGTWPPMFWPVLAYVLISILSLTQAASLQAGRGLARNLVTSTLLFLAAYWSMTDRRKLVWLLGGFALGGLFVGFHAALDYARGGEAAVGFVTTGGELIGREAAGFTQPNELGGFLAVTVPLAALGILTGASRTRVVFALAIVAAVFGVYASVSRGALLGLAVVPFVFLRGWRLWLIGPIVAALLLVATPTVVQERFATLSSSGPEVATRLDIWRVAVHVWETHPILGVGLGGFPAAYSDAHIAGKLFLPSTVFAPPPHAHDVFLQIMAEQGTLGLLAFVATIAGAVITVLNMRRARDVWLRRAGSGLLAALAVFLAHDLFDVTLEDPQTGLYIFALLGVIAGVSRLADAARAETRDESSRLVSAVG